MEIGIIGLGDMGLSTARRLSQLGYNISGCDVPEKLSEIRRALAGTNVQIYASGTEVARRNDIQIYSVPAEKIEEIVAKLGPYTKPGVIIIGETSVKTPEVQAFEKYLPSSANIVPLHQMYGPTVDPLGKNLVMVHHTQCSTEAYRTAKELYGKFGANMIDLANYQEHDKITADVQATTQTGFLSMATAWKKRGFFPWKNSAYIGGIDNVKILLALRILSNKAHIYSGIAILNPFAREQISQYAKSTAELFDLAITGQENALRKRLEEAAGFVFDLESKEKTLDDTVMGELSLGKKNDRKPNSHLSQFALIDSWHQLKIKPHKNDIYSTPLSKLRLEIAEYLYKNEELRNESLNALLYDKSIREDDLEFVIASHEWNSIVKRRDVARYQQQFDETKAFFQNRIAEAMKMSNELIKRLT